MFTAYRYDQKTGNAPDAPGWTQEDFLFTTKFIQIECWDNPMLIQLAYDDALTWGDSIEIDQENPPLILPIAVRHVQVQNKTLTLVARYQVIGMG